MRQGLTAEREAQAAKKTKDINGALYFACTFRERLAFLPREQFGQFRLSRFKNLGGFVQYSAPRDRRCFAPTGIRVHGCGDRLLCFFRPAQRIFRYFYARVRRINILYRLPPCAPTHSPPMKFSYFRIYSFRLKAGGRWRNRWNGTKLARRRIRQLAHPWNCCSEVCPSVACCNFTVNGMLSSCRAFNAISIVLARVIKLQLLNVDDEISHQEIGIAWNNDIDRHIDARHDKTSLFSSTKLTFTLCWPSSIRPKDIRRTIEHCG